MSASASDWFWAWAAWVKAQRGGQYVGVFVRKLSNVASCSCLTFEQQASENALAVPYRASTFFPDLTDRKWKDETYLLVLLLLWSFVKICQLTSADQLELPKDTFQVAGRTVLGGWSKVESFGATLEQVISNSTQCLNGIVSEEWRRLEGIFVKKKREEHCFVKTSLKGKVIGGVSKLVPQWQFRSLSSCCCCCCCRLIWPFSLS